eukprot:3933205-Rhodomonas_salina.3
MTARSNVEQSCRASQRVGSRWAALRPPASAPLDMWCACRPGQSTRRVRLQDPLARVPAVAAAPAYIIRQTSVHNFHYISPELPLHPTVISTELPRKEATRSQRSQRG